MAPKVFINLAVEDLDRSIGFFRALGFAFNEQFTDETAACMIVSDQVAVMLLTHEKFAGFTPNPICDSHASTEVLISLSCDSREQLDGYVRTAVESGGRTYNEPQDHGFMYGHGFQDPDGHIWELIYMNPETASGTGTTSTV